LKCCEGSTNDDDNDGDGDEESRVMYMSCSEVASGNTILHPIDNYQPDNTYEPYVGYQTGITISGQMCDYKLVSYNQPSIYGGNYCLYLPYEYDPIAKIVYAFCV